MCQGEQKTLLYCRSCQQIVDEPVEPSRPCHFVERNRAAWCRTSPQPVRSQFLRDPCRECRDIELQQAQPGFYSHQRRGGQTAPSVVDSEDSDIIPLPVNPPDYQEARHNNGHFEDDRPPRQPRPTRPANEDFAGPSDRDRPMANPPARDNTLFDDEAVRRAMMRDLRSRGVLPRDHEGSTNNRRLIEAALPAFLANDHAGYESVVALFMEAMRPGPVDPEPYNSDSGDIGASSTARGGGTRRNAFGPGSHPVIRDASGRMCDVRSKKKTSKKR